MIYLETQINIRENIINRSRGKAREYFLIFFSYEQNPRRSLTLIKITNKMLSSPPRRSTLYPIRMIRNNNRLWTPPSLFFSCKNCIYKKSKNKNKNNRVQTTEMEEKKERRITHETTKLCTQEQSINKSKLIFGPHDP
jgi:hypothetical protein